MKYKLNVKWLKNRRKLLKNRSVLRKIGKNRNLTQIKQYLILITVLFVYIFVSDSSPDVVSIVKLNKHHKGVMPCCELSVQMKHKTLVLILVKKNLKRISFLSQTRLQPLPVQT